MSRSTVLFFPRRKPLNTKPDYRISNRAYYAALDATLGVEDLACRIADTTRWSRSTRRQLSRRAETLADTLAAVLGAMERLP